MKLTAVRILFSFTLVFAIALPAQAKHEPAKHDQKAEISKPETPNYLSLGVVDGESSEQMSIVNIRLDRKPPFDKLTLEAHGSFLQLKLPHTITSNPGTFFEGHSPYIQKIAVYQTEPDEAVIRLFTSVDANLIKDSAEADILDNRIVISVDHKSLQAKLPAQNTPADLVKTEKAAEDKGDTPGRTFNLDKQLRNLAIFSIAFFLLVLGSLSFMRLKRNRRILATAEPVIKMQTLGDLPLAPKQKLTLIQVGKERILLSVSPESISLITHLNPDGTVAIPAQVATAVPGRPSFQNMLASNPGATGKPMLKAPAKAPTAPAQPKQVGGTAGAAQASTATTNAGTAAPKATPRQGAAHKKIQYAIDDDGIKDRTIQSAPKPNRDPSTERAIDDVTKLIREKLKSLPKIS